MARDNINTENEELLMNHDVQQEKSDTSSATVLAIDHHG